MACQVNHFPCRSYHAGLSHPHQREHSMLRPFLDFISNIQPRSNELYLVDFRPMSIGREPRKPPPHEMTRKHESFQLGCLSSRSTPRFIHRVMICTSLHNGVLSGGNGVVDKRHPKPLTSSVTAMMLATPNQ